MRALVIALCLACGPAAEPVTLPPAPDAGAPAVDAGRPQVQAATYQCQLPDGGVETRLFHQPCP